MSDKSRRKLLKSIAAGSGAIVAGKSLPESWSRPVVDAVVLPAHAQTSARMFSGNNLQALLDNEKSLFAQAMEISISEANAGDQVQNRYIVDACATESGSNLDVKIQIIDTEVPDTHEYTAMLPIAGGTVTVSPVDLCSVTCTSTLDMNVISVVSNAHINLDGLGEIMIPIATKCVPFSDLQCPQVNCLAHDTIILTPGNQCRAIDSLQIGSLVSAIDKYGASLFTVVTKVVTQHMRSDFYTINAALRITGDHPILVERDHSLLWCRVDDLDVGDLIRSLNGNIEIKSIEYHDQPLETVYVETQCGNFIALADSDHYVVKSNYVEATERLQQGEEKVFA